MRRFLVDYVQNSKLTRYRVLIGRLNWNRPEMVIGFSVFRKKFKKGTKSGRRSLVNEN